MRCRAIVSCTGFVLMLMAVGMSVSGCNQDEEPRDKPPLEVKEEEAKDSTRLDPAPDTGR
ncbi:hypothetical protein GF356_08110 [candidate division GN15 bacterium]|nr:hypothetical protein [candidate division GN15 bacterium]